MQKNDAYSESRRNLGEANQTERDLNNQLILVSTVVLGVIGAILAGSIFSEGVTLVQAILAMLGAAFGLSAILSGVRHYFQIIAFNGLWASAQREIGRKYEEMSLIDDRSSLDSLGDNLNKYIASLPEKSKQFWLYAELILVLSAGCSLLLLVAAVVFDWGVLKDFLGV